MKQDTLYKKIDSIGLDKVESIANATDSLNGDENIEAINEYFLRIDESNLWPISGRFNATERAIAEAKAISDEVGQVYGYEYCCLLESIISRIVNEEV